MFRRLNPKYGFLCTIRNFRFSSLQIAIACVQHEGVKGSYNGPKFQKVVFWELFWAVLSSISAIRALLYGHITGKKVANGGRHHLKAFRALGDSENLNFQILTTSFGVCIPPRNPCFGVFWAILSSISAIRALLYRNITGKKGANGGIIT